MITLGEPLAVPVPGGTLTAYRIGSARADAPLALAVHGITATAASWLAVADALGDDAALIAVDLRGRGASRSLPAPFGLDAHVRDLVAVLDALGLPAPVVTGHSLGAYIAARLAVTHPERVSRLVLVDGGLSFPLAADVDRDAFVRGFLAAAIARLEMTFPDPTAYRDWWLAHPAIAGAEIEPWVLDGYAGHDLVGHAPALRSSVNPEVLSSDGVEVLDADDAARLEHEAVLLTAPRGLQDEPSPMQPPELAQRWAQADPGRRRAVQLPDVNHYTITLGTPGAARVAEALRDSLGERPQRSPSSTSTTS